VTPSLPRCGDCQKLATGAIFVPSLAAAEYVLAVCDRHDLMGDGEHFSLAAMRDSPAAFLAAFDGQIVDVDEALRGWLVEAGRKVAQPAVLTVAQAAVREEVSERQVQRWCEQGALGAGAWRTGDGERSSWRIAPDALDARRAKPRARRPAKVEPADVTAPRRSRSVAW
jgi:hypothetical protein